MNVDIERFIKQKALEINIQNMNNIYRQIFGQDTKYEALIKETMATNNDKMMWYFHSTNNNEKHMKIELIETKILQELQLLNFVNQNS